jgi:hypothetical protein
LGIPLDGISDPFLEQFVFCLKFVVLLLDGIDSFEEGYSMLAFD